ncbi:MAG: GGDEF domain-containing protein [Terracidiphilus sp.]|jgi:diguanylate cyclase (GGDEF)-like protein
MISLKKYLEAASPGSEVQDHPDESEILPATIAAYRSALSEMGDCGVEVCPALGEELKQGLSKSGDRLSPSMSCETVQETERDVRQKLEDWGKKAARHYHDRTEEVKGLLIVLARTAESVGERDQRCKGQISDVTAQLKRIASLDDLTEIRASIERSAADLKTSVDRMAADGKAAIEHLRAEVSVYQTKLEEAETKSSHDPLTGVRSRVFAERQIARRIAEGTPHCIAIVDIDGFKQVNDEHGHPVGDELLKQFAGELKSASRTTDVIARWGGDEFLVLLDCDRETAKSQTERLREWVCGNYKIHGTNGLKTLKVNASIGLAAYMKGEPMIKVIERADAAMYADKAASRRANGVAMPR